MALYSGTSTTSKAQTVSLITSERIQITRSSPYTYAEILEAVTLIIGEIKNVNPAIISPTHMLGYDWGLDSLDMLQLTYECNISLNLGLSTSQMAVLMSGYMTKTIANYAYQIYDMLD